MGVGKGRRDFGYARVVEGRLSWGVCSRLSFFRSVSDVFWVLFCYVFCLFFCVGFGSFFIVREFEA